MCQYKQYTNEYRYIGIQKRLTSRRAKDAAPGSLLVFE